jgi:hypothetical protein
LACSNSVILVSCHSCEPNRNGEFAASATCTPATAWAAFQGAELLRADLQVQLEAGTGGLAHDRAEHGVEPLGAVDDDPDLLATGGEDLLVEQPVARHRGHRAAGDVELPQRRQDTDHRHPAAGRTARLIGAGEHVPHLVLEPGQRVAAQRARRDVHLDVEPGQLGRPGRVAEQPQDLGVAGGRRGLGVDQVQLHLESDPALGGLHRPVPQHQR